MTEFMSQHSPDRAPNLALYKRLPAPLDGNDEGE